MTLSALRRSTWPVVSGGLGKSSNSSAWISATAKGTGMSSRRFLRRCSVILTSSRSVYSGTGKLVGSADGCGVGEYADDSLRHVFHKDWLQSGTAAGDQRQYRQPSGKLGECAEQCVARAKHGARADDRSLRKSLLDHLFAASSSTDVRRP